MQYSISGCFQPATNVTIQQPVGTAPIPTATPTPTSTPTPTATPTPAPEVIQLSVDIKNFVFSPVTVNIKGKGRTIVWANMDNVSHTVTSTTGDFDSGSIGPGKTFRYTFNKAGTFEYQCTIHPYIPHGKVIVTEE